MQSFTCARAESVKLMMIMMIIIMMIQDGGSACSNPDLAVHPPTSPVVRTLNNSPYTQDISVGALT